MSKKTVQVLLRADRAVMGAFVFALLISAACMTFAQYTEQAEAMTRIAAVVAPPRPQQQAAPKPLKVAPSAFEIALIHVLKERECLAEAMYYEARGEGPTGEEAIAEVIFNRMRLAGYPNTICGVVYEGAALHKGCQFSFACNGAMLEPRSPMAWAEARQMATKIITGQQPLLDLTGGATSYHAADVQPVWADTLLQTVQIGNHIFYREPPRTRSS